MRVCQQSKPTWELNQDLVPGSEEPVIESRFPSGKPENPENDEIPNSENDDMNNNKHEYLKYNITEKIRNRYEIMMYLTIINWQRTDESQFSCISTNSLGKADGRIQSYSKSNSF